MAGTFSLSNRPSIPQRMRTPSQVPLASGAVHSITEDWFLSEGVRCHAWLVLPPPVVERAVPPPVVVMAFGIAAQKDMGFLRYAEEFAAAGLASYLIDYRTFGGSDGAPRNSVDPPAHVADIVAAARHVANDARVDGARVALWGTSLAGGHVLLAAEALGGSVRAVVSQCPSLDGKENLKYNFETKGQLGGAGVYVGVQEGRFGGGGGGGRNRAPGPHRNTARQAMDGLWTEVCGRQKQSNDPGNNQHILNTPTIGRR